MLSVLDDGYSGMASLVCPLKVEPLGFMQGYKGHEPSAKPTQAGILHYTICCNKHFSWNWLVMLFAQAFSC